MFRKAVFFSLAMLLLLGAFALNPKVSHAQTASATAATPPSTVDFAAIQKNCAIVNVHLDGAKHTIDCAKVRVSGSTRPEIVRFPCLSGRDMEVTNYNETGQLCFFGYGYIGVKIYQVNHVYNFSAFQEAWTRYYNSAGHFCTIGRYSSANFGGGYTNVLVTQLDLGGSNGPYCPY